MREEKRHTRGCIIPRVHVRLAVVKPNSNRSMTDSADTPGVACSHVKTYIARGRGFMTGVNWKLKPISQAYHRFNRVREKQSWSS